MPLCIAIIGAGPAGCYAAAALLAHAQDKELEIDLIDRLPTPFGLVRGGVAPDHPETKQVQRSFAEVFADRRVSFFGDVELGGHVSLKELRTLYDVVILALGASEDRRLGVPGERLAGVYGSADFVGWYNGHPDFADLAPDLSAESAVVIGLGNVALDVARVLLRPIEQLARTDISDLAMERLRQSRIKRVTILGRRGPVEAKFSPPELRELAELDLEVTVEPPLLDTPPLGLGDRDLRLAWKRLDILRGLIGKGAKDRQLHFQFHGEPLAFVGEGKLSGLDYVDYQGHRQHLPCGLAITAIGYRTPPIPGLSFDPQVGRPEQEAPGEIAEGLYAVGWCARGPSGVIGSNKHDGEAVALNVWQKAKAEGKAGRRGLRAHLVSKRHPWADWDAWLAIEQAERDGGKGKLNTWAALRQAAGLAK